MSYNGWKNRETWNVALWMGNDEGLYNLARESRDYDDFTRQMREMGATETPDGVSYTDSRLDIPRLDELVLEFNGGRFMTFSDWCGKVKMTCAAGGAKTPYEKMDEWQKQAIGYRVTLAYEGRKMSLDFWQGRGNTHRPRAEDVLDCLISDASTYDNASDFEDWCSELCFDADSRKAEKTYRQVERQTKRLKRLLGSDYETFIDAER